MAKYKDLQKRVMELEKKLFFFSTQVTAAHSILDGLDVPKSESGAFVGHRWHWYTDGKRESYKTRENSEGYSPEEFERRKNASAEVKSGKFAKPKLPIVE
jgi:hypothetical protein